jgi:hypothetical protein
VATVAGSEAFGIQSDLDQSGCNRVSRRKDPFARSIANLGRAATVQAAYRGTFDRRAFAPQAISPMRCTRHSLRRG